MILRLVFSFVFSLFFSAVFVSAQAADACVISAYCDLNNSQRISGMNTMREGGMGFERPDQVILRATWIDAYGIQHEIYEPKKARTQAIDGESRMKQWEETKNLLAKCESDLKSYTSLSACAKNSKK